MISKICQTLVSSSYLVNILYNKLVRKINYKVFHKDQVEGLNSSSKLTLLEHCPRPKTGYATWRSTVFTWHTERKGWDGDGVEGTTTIGRRLRQRVTYCGVVGRDKREHLKLGCICQQLVHGCLHVQLYHVGITTTQTRAMRLPPLRLTLSSQASGVSIATVMLPFRLLCTR